jgi:hypothetical protein
MRHVCDAAFVDPANRLPKFKRSDTHQRVVCAVDGTEAARHRNSPAGLSYKERYHQPNWVPHPRNRKASGGVVTKYSFRASFPWSGDRRGGVGGLCGSCDDAGGRRTARPPCSDRPCSSVLSLSLLLSAGSMAWASAGSGSVRARQAVMIRPGIASHTTFSPAQPQVRANGIVYASDVQHFARLPSGNRGRARPRAPRPR